MTSVATTRSYVHEAPDPGRGPAYHAIVARVVLSALFAGNGAVIVWLWLNGGGVSAVNSTAALLTSIGRITGLLGAYLALVQVLLLSRLIVLERLVGFDRLTVWHRLNGKVCLGLVLAHTVLITIGYALADRLAIPKEVTTLLERYPGMVTATVGTGIFILVVVTSLVIVRRRLRYEAWYAVHLSAYAAIALAWFHQVPTGNEFVANPGPTRYWTSLYIATIIVLVIFRIFLPTFHALKYRLLVVEVVRESPSVVSLRFGGTGLERLRAQPGQFFLWRFLTLDRWWESHPFSLSAAPNGHTLRITVKSVGDFSGQIGQIQPGTRVVTEGPFGVFTSASRRRTKVALIAGGIGITPIRALIEEMPGDLTVLYRVISNEDVIFRGELDRLANDRGIEVVYIVGDHTLPENEHLLGPRHVLELLPDIRERDVYVCGPPAMVTEIEKTLRGVGVDQRALHIERFAL